MDKFYDEYKSNKLMISTVLTIFGCISVLWMGKNIYMAKYALGIINFLTYFKYVVYAGFLVSGCKFLYDLYKKKNFLYKYFASDTIFSFFSQLMIAQVVLEIYGVNKSAPAYIASIYAMILVVKYAIISHSKTTVLITVGTFLNLTLIYMAGNYIESGISLVLYSISVLTIILSVVLVTNASKNEGKIKGVKLFDEDSDFEILKSTGLGLLFVTIVSAIIEVLGLFAINVGLCLSLAFMVVTLFKMLNKKL